MLGTAPATDSETPPVANGFPWHTALALALVYVLGVLGWHWAYGLPVFWLLIHMEERRWRRHWAVLQVEANTAAAVSRDDETVTWINQLLRAVWPMYEPPVARYMIAKAQPMIDESVPRSLGVFAIHVKKFSFGRLEGQSRRGGMPPRFAPVICEKVRMISKSVDDRHRDPRRHRIRFVMQTNVRWHAGSSPALVLLIQLGPKLLSVRAEPRP